MSHKLSFLAADVFGGELLDPENGVLVGDKLRTFDFGPWTYSVCLHAEGVDCGGECGLFIRMTNRLWFYVYLVEKGRPLLYVVDALEAGITLENVRKVLTRKTPAVIAAGIKGVKKILSYNSAAKMWVVKEN